MKYLVLAAVLAVAYLLWRNARMAGRRPGAAAPPPAAPADGALEMVRCPVCAVHLPRSEAVPDDNGTFYCSPEHRQRGATPDRP